MASLLRRTAILSFSRFTNQAIVLLSPVLLVRILSIAEYGSYREFLVYVGLVSPLVSFGVARSLQYLLPKHPEEERTWVTQTVLFTMAFSSIAIIAIYFAGNLIRSRTSFDFVTALQLYVFFFVNLDFIELYWLGKKRTDYVLYYSVGRLLARVTVIITAALLTESAATIVYSMVVLEAVRCALVFGYASAKRWFTTKITRSSLQLQLSYFLPLGAGAVVETLNSNIGTLFISATIGPEALAFFAIGFFARKIVDTLRGAIADVIFPDIVEIKSKTAKDSLPLWQRATVWYCMMLFPIAILFSYYADAIVTILFTSAYSAAIPVFAVFSFMLFLDSFDFHLPLRVQNQNRYFGIGSVIALVANVLLLYPMFLVFGLVGPAIAFVASRLLITFYLANRTLHVYRMSASELAYWKDIGKTLIAALAGLPILFAGKELMENLFFRGVLFGAAYLAAYFVLLRLLRVSEATAMARGILERIKTSRKQVGEA